MDHSLKILLGTFFSFVILIIFYSLFDRFYTKGKQSVPRGQGVPILLQRNDKQADNKFIYEEYANSNIVACLYQDKNVVGAACLFTGDLKIEYIVEENKHGLVENVTELIRKWGPIWGKLSYCNSIHLLVDDRALVKAINEGQRTLNVQHEVEEKYGLKINFHWTDNFFVDEGFNYELWDDLILLVKRLGKKHVDPWSDFVVGHWDRKRVCFSNNNQVVGQLIDLSI